MAIEIERKYLVTNDAFKNEAHIVLAIKQGFLSTDKDRVVRIRISNNTGFITIKGLSSKDGTSRYEWEKEISKNEALELLNLCKKPILEKNRFLVKKGNHIFEVDEFEGENSGLTIAEIELKTPDENFEKPKWLGNEVTGISKYYNSELSKKSFKNW